MGKEMTTAELLAAAEKIRAMRELDRLKAEREKAAAIRKRQAERLGVKR